MPSMIAGKNLPYYGTRRLRPGDGFQATEADANVLYLLGRATYDTRGAVPASNKKARPKRQSAPPPATQSTTTPATMSDSELTTLRNDFTELTGELPDESWDADRLKSEIDAKLAGQG